MMETSSEDRRLDRIVIKDLLLRGIIGINPKERENRQDILLNVTLWADTRSAGKSDQIEDTVNYRTVTKQLIAYTEENEPYLVEHLAAELAALCVKSDERIAAVEITVEKPGALRFTQSVGVTIYRTRDELLDKDRFKAESGG